MQSIPVCTESEHYLAVVNQLIPRNLARINKAFQKIQATNTKAELHLLFVFPKLPHYFYIIPSAKQQHQQELNTVQQRLQLLGKHLNVPPHHLWLKQGKLASVTKSTTHELQALLLWPKQPSKTTRQQLIKFKTLWHSFQTWLARHLAPL